MRITVGIPLHNEEEIIPALLARLLPVIDRLDGGPHDVLFVDDGSTDQARVLLRGAARKDPRVRIVALSRNFGQQAAFSAALDHAKGDVLLMMDGDLQDDPEVLPELVRQHVAGADVVYVRRASREEGLLTRVLYKAFYR